MILACGWVPFWVVKALLDIFLFRHFLPLLIILGHRWMLPCRGCLSILLLWGILGWFFVEKSADWWSAKHILVLWWGLLYGFFIFKVTVGLDSIISSISEVIVGREGSLHVKSLHSDLLSHLTLSIVADWSGLWSAEFDLSSTSMAPWVLCVCQFTLDPPPSCTGMGEWLCERAFCLPTASPRED